MRRNFKHKNDFLLYVDDEQEDSVIEKGEGCLPDGYTFKYYTDIKEAILYSKNSGASFIIQPRNSEYEYEYKGCIYSLCYYVNKSYNSVSQVYNSYNKTLGG